MDKEPATSRISRNMNLLHGFNACAWDGLPINAEILRLVLLNYAQGEQGLNAEKSDEYTTLGIK